MNKTGYIPGLKPDEWSNDACRVYLLWKICVLAVFRQIKSPDGMPRAGFCGFQHP